MNSRGGSMVSRGSAEDATRHSFMDASRLAGASNRLSVTSRGTLGTTISEADIHVHDGPASDQERKRNRQMLKDLYEHLPSIESDAEMYKEQSNALEAEMRELRRVVQDLHRSNTEMRRSLEAGEVASMVQQTVQKIVLAELRTMQQTVHQTLHADISASVKEELSAMRSRLSQDQNEVRQNIKALQSGNEVRSLKQDLENKLQTVERTQESLQREVNQVQQHIEDLHDHKKQHQVALERLRSGMHSTDEFTRFTSMAQLTHNEFFILRKQIYDRGVLAPVREEPIEEDNPPVGTLVLADDVFTARLLLKLSFLKQRYATQAETNGYSAMRSIRVQKRSHTGEWSDSEEDSSALSGTTLDHLNVFESVGGIMEMETRKGHAGYCAVTWGWLSICVLTLVVQIFILVLMMQTYYEEPGCFKVLPKPYVDTNWWMLHISRALAMVVGGALMTKELMDCMNCFMVSFFLEPRISLEVVLTTFVRIGLIGAVMAANIFLFMSYVEPGFIWVNMACLSYVASLGKDSLSVAKTGVFGHNIQKAVTNVNFELSFHQEYPIWFSLVSKATIYCSVCGIIVMAVVAFTLEDRECSASPGGTPGERQ